MIASSFGPACPGSFLLSTPAARPGNLPVAIARGRTRSAPVKVQPSVKKICEKCRVIRRHGRVMVICSNPRHKQRQG